MSHEESLKMFAREVHDLRLLVYLLMHIRADDNQTPGELDGSVAVTDFEELEADFCDLASCLTKQQWLAGLRAFDYVSALNEATDEIEFESKSTLNRLYYGYKSMHYTDYFLPRLESKRNLRNGLTHIENEFKGRKHCQESTSTEPEETNHSIVIQ